MPICSWRLLAIVSLTGACTASVVDDKEDTTESDTELVSETDDSSGVVDITDAVFTSRDGDCASYAGAYTSTVMDVQSGDTFSGAVSLTNEGTTCTITANSIPNHDFNDGGSFATEVAEVDITHTIPRNPSAAGGATALSLQVDNGIFLNGVKLDLLAAACYGVGGEVLGQERIGCMQTDTPWRYDPVAAGFGVDTNSAHVQPTGAYHYHADPGAMYDTTGAAASGVIGFAADGFPIFGPWISDGGTVRRVLSGYALKAGDRVSQAGEGAFPGGAYDGTYIDDYVWDEANGDLDACNGMTADGVYGYYLTAGYPYVMACFMGAPDASFSKGPPG